MIVNCSKPKISEYDFFRLLTSTISKEKHNSVIKKIDLEKNLYHFYDSQDYHFLFEDVCKKESIDNCYVDLNSSFQTACAFGLIILIRDSEI
ncbi:MAG: hypothetical protein E7168_00690 [Firmicutes bacterium]|nr:hypothetical protein [Bacillota bacterium]